MNKDDIKNNEEKKDENQIPNKLYELVAQVLTYVERIDNKKE